MRERNGNGNVEGQFGEIMQAFSELSRRSESRGVKAGDMVRRTVTAFLMESKLQFTEAQIIEMADHAVSMNFDGLSKELKTKLVEYIHNLARK